MFSKLHNLYYFVRLCRAYDQARQRRLYRQIAKEKKRLVAAGVDAEQVRLLCRLLANPKNMHAQRRYLQNVTTCNTLINNDCKNAKSDN